MIHFQALDFKTDAKLRAALKADEEIQKHVVVIVGQRVSTIADADLILVLDKGKVVGQGDPPGITRNEQGLPVNCELPDPGIKGG